MGALPSSTPAVLGLALAGALPVLGALAVGDPLVTGLLHLPLVGVTVVAHVRLGPRVAGVGCLAVAVVTGLALVLAGAPLAAATLGVVLVLASAVPAGLLVARQVARSVALVDVDALTGLHTRRAVLGELERARAGTSRTGTPLTLLALDIEGFRAFNAEHGTEAGDHLLRTAAARWEQQLRPDDRLARTGGDEFLAVLRDCRGDDATRVAERLRGATPPQVRVAIGIAMVDPLGTTADALRAVDDALHTARRWGGGISLAPDARHAAPTPPAAPAARLVAAGAARATDVA